MRADTAEAMCVSSKTPIDDLVVVLMSASYGQPSAQETVSRLATVVKNTLVRPSRMSRTVPMTHVVFACETENI